MQSKALTFQVLMWKKSDLLNEHWIKETQESPFYSSKNNTTSSWGGQQLTITQQFHFLYSHNWLSSISHNWPVVPNSWHFQKKMSKCVLNRRRREENIDCSCTMMPAWVKCGSGVLTIVQHPWELKLGPEPLKDIKIESNSSLSCLHWFHVNVMPFY